MSTFQTFFRASNFKSLAWRRGGMALLLSASLGASAGILDGSEPMELTGQITALTSPAAFTVGGVNVDAGKAANKAGPLAANMRVEVKGRLNNGVFIAKRVEIEDDVDFDGLEIWGKIDSLNLAQQTFVLRGVTVNYVTGTTVFEDGTEAQLANGRRVEVEGQLAADGVSVDAQRIDFDD
jgi:hypothetical protein